MRVAHVGHISWAADEESDKINDAALAEFDTREVKPGYFRYCGSEAVQGPDHAINVTAKGNVERLEAVSYHRDSGLSRKCNDGGTTRDQICRRSFVMGRTTVHRRSALPRESTAEDHEPRKGASS